MSMVDAELLKILRCPETQQPVSEADAVLVADLNSRIGAGTLKNSAGKAVSTKLEAALVRKDGAVAYPVRNRIPIMLIEEAIRL
jgi:uncharacterized protein YbaR (Trm112 family)